MHEHESIVIDRSWQPVTTVESHLAETLRRHLRENALEVVDQPDAIRSHERQCICPRARVCSVVADIADIEQIGVDAGQRRTAMVKRYSDAARTKVCGRAGAVHRPKPCVKIVFIPYGACDQKIHTLEAADGVDHLV